MESTSSHHSKNDSASRRGDSHLRLVTPEENVVLPVGAEAGDDSPTIISKNHPVAEEAFKQGAPRETLATTLRGRQLAHFELIEPIGVGGMAAVIRARDTQLDRFVALKILPPEMAADEENIRRFHQEARAAAKLDHENIARVFFCGEDQRLHFIAFEFVEGENLRVILERRGRLPVGEAVRYVLQIATGLEHAASRSVVHRDIKPSNIIITPTGKAKLVDMGLARSLEPQKDPQLTQSGVTLGTFDYISPEQALEPRDADARSDLYSLGCTFYHMLTGQAPVPDGTAAKKLHHHQHVAPIDPRQLNPAIPDEVAAIIGKMMAKDPRDRYQRPIFLVQHLMQIAQKVGAAADLPEGGIIVEAPLPQPPRKRPLLIISLAALALAVQIFLISLASQPDAPPPARASAPPEKEKAGRDSGPRPPVRPTPVETTSSDIRSEADLAKALTAPGPEITALLQGTIDLGDGLTFHGEGKRHLTIESLRKKEQATLRFKAPLYGEAGAVFAGLTIDGGTVTIRNVRFEIQANSTPEFALAVLAIRGNAQVRLQKCTFFQEKVPQTPLLGVEGIVPIASVLIDNDHDALTRPNVSFEQCHFFGTGKDTAEISGQVAVAVNGTADITVIDGAFQPHRSLVHLRGSNKDFGTTVRFNRCSAFVYNGPAFRFDDESRTVLQVQNSIFSGRDSAGSDPPALLLQTTAKAPLVRFDGQHNCYHNLASLWIRKGDAGNRFVDGLDEFNLLTKEVEGKGDERSAHLIKAPTIWDSPTPLKEERDRIFILRPDVEEVRGPDHKTALGIRDSVWGEVEQPAFVRKEAAPTEPSVKLAANEKLVDPEAPKGDPAHGIFNNLGSALALANPGDVILIKQPKGRLLEVSPAPLEKAVIDLTFRPFSKSDRPILTMAENLETDAAFFRLQEGKLHFEDLDFILEPDQSGFTRQNLVTMAGSVSCTFKNCIITLRPSDKDKLATPIPVSVVSLLEPSKAMAMSVKTLRSVPEIAFENTFVRGEGDLISVRSSRPFRLAVDRSLLCLAGSVVRVKGADKDVPMDVSASIRLTQVSAFTAKPLVALYGGMSAKSYVPLAVERAKSCVFTALADKPLIHIESPENTEDGVRQIFTWKGEGNAYCNFLPPNVYLQNYRMDDSQVTISLEKQGWKDFSGETESHFPRTPFILPAALVRAPWLALPDDVSPPKELVEDLMDRGAQLDLDLISRLPKKGETPPTSP